ncbi:hypothetical protein D3C76_1846990 [compost metagenome]
MAVFYVFRLLAEAAANHHEEHRNKEQGQHGGGNHPAHNAGTYRVLCAGACTVTDNQRQYPEDEGQ